MKKIALITGINGQDGSYLAELLLEKGYEVHGIIRRSSSFNTQKIDHIYDKLKLHYGDMVDSLSIDNIVNTVKPNEIYHLAAQSHVAVSFKIPKYTADVDATGTLILLEAMRKHVPDAKFYNAATSELFGKIVEVPQNELTPFYPRSPYGVAKLYSYWIVKNYREAYDLFAVNGILFNHESERRGSTFVTKKITEGLSNYILNKKTIYMGNLNSKRDWGYAPDYVAGMHLMLQHDKPEDFVLATGEEHTIFEFIDESIKTIKNLGIDINFEWRLDSENREYLWDVDNERIVIGVNEKYYRPTEVDRLLGDPTKANEELGWKPNVKFNELVKIMMTNDLKLRHIV